ncbi:MAG: tol-pal system protein YbgF [Pseudomonadota bacterium]
MKDARYVVVAAMLAASIYGCASQQDVHTLDDRMQAVAQNAQQSSRTTESRINDLEKDMAARNQEMRQQTARLSASLARIDEEMARLRGSIDELDHRFNEKLKGLEGAERARQSADAKQSEAVAALRAQTLRIEEYLNLEPETDTGGKGIPPVADADEKKQKTSLSAKDMYDLAKQAYDNGSLETARQGFDALIKAYPDAPQADNAQFWIGETFYREKWYEKAILEYHKVIKNYPKGNKVPAALLKQGLAFSQLKDATNARLVLSELVKKYPDTNEAAIAKKILDRLK